MITPIADINALTTGISVKGAICMDASSFIYINDVGSIIRSTYSNQAIAAGTISTGAAGIALYSSASAVVCFIGTSRFELVDLATLQVTPITTSANTVYTNSNSQQIAANPNTGFAMATRPISNAVQIINCLTRQCTAVTGLPFGTQQVACVITKDNNFVVGTEKGTLYEINTNGTVVSSFEIPRSPNSGLTTTYFPLVSLCYPGSGMVVAANAGGTISVINMAASSVVSEVLGAEFTSPGGGLALSNCSSGIVAYSSDNPSGVYQGFNEAFIDTKGVFRPLDTTYFNTYIPNGTRDIHIDPTGTRGVWITNDINGNTFKIRTFSIDPTGTVSVKTRIQYPIGVDITGNIIRIRDRGPGKSVIDYDQNVASGDIFPPAADDNNYVEIVLNGTGPSELWDIREFKA